MDYSKGKIYKIVDSTNDDIYIGSTITTLKQRWNVHRMFRDYDKNKEDCEIILIEDYPCESERQLHEREQYYLDNTECINRSDAVMNIEKRKKKAVRAAKEYRRNNKDKCNEQQNIRREYQKTWGGRYQNNLLSIDPDYFLV